MMVQAQPPPRYPGPQMQPAGVEQRPHFVGQRYPGPPVGARMPEARNVPPAGAIPIDPLLKRQQQHMQAFRNPRPINPLLHQEQMRMQMSQQGPRMLSPNSQPRMMHPPAAALPAPVHQQAVRAETQIGHPNQVVVGTPQQQAANVPESKPPVLVQNVSQANHELKPPEELSDQKPVLKSEEEIKEEEDSKDEVQRIFTDKVPVPVGWRRLVLSESVVYYR